MTAIAGLPQQSAALAEGMPHCRENRPSTKARSIALSRSEPPRSISATRRSNALAALVRPSSSRRISSCGWVALCERRRAGFARLSGWQPVGNWVVSAGEFSSIPVIRRRYPDNEQKNRDGQFAPKNGPKPKPSVTPQIVVGLFAGFWTACHRAPTFFERGGRAWV